MSLDGGKLPRVIWITRQSIDVSQVCVGRRIYKTCFVCTKFGYSFCTSVLVSLSSLHGKGVVVAMFEFHPYGLR
jgi:hypothetical protein